MKTLKRVLRVTEVTYTVVSPTGFESQEFNHRIIGKIAKSKIVKELRKEIEQPNEICIKSIVEKPFTLELDIEHLIEMGLITL